MAQSVVSAIKQWLDRNIYGYKRKEPGQDLLECLEYARLAVNAERVSMVRGTITKGQFEQRFNDIAQKHYSNLKLRIRLMVSCKRFKDTLTMEL